MLIGAALFNARQTGLDKQQAVREKLAELACYREGINAHLTAAIATAQPSPAGLLMPNQSLLFTGRVHACTKLPAMMHLARELCGGQICVTPDFAAFQIPKPARGWRSSTRVNEAWIAEDRRKLLAFARDLLNSDYAGHRLTFQLFAQSPPYAHLNAVYGTSTGHRRWIACANPPVCRPKGYGAPRLIASPDQRLHLARRDPPRASNPRLRPGGFTRNTNCNRIRKKYVHGHSPGAE